MRRLAAALVLVVLLTATIKFAASLDPPIAEAQPPAGRPGGPPDRPSVDAPHTHFESLNQDSIAAERDSMMKAELVRIAGRENAPAESVFKNIKLMKGVPAERVLRAMGAFSRSLGVSCRYCHVPGHWADDDKSHKLVARDMMVMARAINDTLLPRVTNPDHDQRFVGCNTCHHGHPNPNWDAPPRPNPPGPGTPPAQGNPPKK